MQLDCGLKQKSLSSHQVSAIRERVRGYPRGDGRRGEAPSHARTPNRKAHSQLARRLHAYNHPDDAKRGVHDMGEHRPGSLQFH